MLSEKKTKNLRDYFPLEMDKALGDAGFQVTQAESMNLLLVGRSQCGKTGIVKALINPRVGIRKCGFADTKDPTCNHLTLDDDSTKKQYNLNIIDTPGLEEVNQHDADRSDKVLLKLARKFLEESITKLHIVCFVSKAGETALKDVKVFRKIMKNLGPGFSECSMMILTKCDAFTVEAINGFKEEIEKHDQTKDIFNYCQLGLFCSGFVDINFLDTQDAENKQEMIRSKLLLLENYRKELLNKIISKAGSGQPLKILEDLSKNAQTTAIGEMSKSWKDKFCIQS